MPESAGQSLIDRVRAKEPGSHEELYEKSFPRFRRIAAALLRGRINGHVLQPTALVSELFLKLRGAESRAGDEEHLYSLAAYAMHQILIDYARSRAAEDETRADSFTESAMKSRDSDPAQRLCANIEFERLRQMNPLVASTVWGHAVEGLRFVELEEIQNREYWRVRADFEFGIRWLRERIRD